ncbi:hypothetical protein RhoFasGS6_04786 [Rhodococcus fascians]|nr:hypothetical protein [Rhodococcus fascians]
MGGSYSVEQSPDGRCGRHSFGERRPTDICRLQHAVDCIDLETGRVERRTPLGEKFGVFGVGRVCRDVQRLGIARRTARGLGRTRAGTVETDRTKVVDIGVLVFQLDCVGPPVTEIVFVRHDGSRVRQHLVDAYPLLTGGVVVRFVVEGLLHFEPSGRPRGSDTECVQVSVFPAHGDLQYRMQLRQQQIRSHAHSSPDRRPRVIDTHPQHQIRQATRGTLRCAEFGRLVGFGDIRHHRQVPNAAGSDRHSYDPSRIGAADPGVTKHRRSILSGR